DRVDPRRTDAFPGHGLGRRQPRGLRAALHALRVPAGHADEPYDADGGLAAGRDNLPFPNQPVLPQLQHLGTPLPDRYRVDPARGAIHDPRPRRRDGRPNRGSGCQFRATFRTATRQAGRPRPQLHRRPTLPGLDRPWNRQLMTVRVNDLGVSGESRLRGAVYDEYSGGGWKAGGRTPVDLPAYIEESLKADINSGAVKGQVIQLTITVDRNSVVGSVLFSPGEPLSASRPFQIEAPSSGYQTIQFPLKNGGEGATDQEILSAVKARVGEDFVGLTVKRNEEAKAVEVGGLKLNGGPLPDALVA